MKVKIKAPKIKIKFKAQKVYPELEELTVTPKATEQIFDDPDVYGYKPVRVEAIDIKLEQKILTPTKEDQPFSVGAGYDAIGGGIVRGVPSIDNNAEFITEATGNRSVLFYMKKIPKLILTGATSLSSFFNGANNLEEIDVSGIDTSNVTTMQYCFNNCSSIQRLDLSSWDFSKVTSMYEMFGGMNILTELTFPNSMDTSIVTTFAYMFSGCGSLEEVDVSKLNTSKATSLMGMFSACRNLKEIDISNFSFENTNGVDMVQMFYNCPELETISRFDCSKTIRLVNTFGVCRKLKNIGGFKNLGQAYSPTAAENYGNYGVYLADTRDLTHDSIINIFNDLFDLTSIGVKPQKINLGTNFDKVTAEEITIATNKGWSVTRN